MVEACFDPVVGCMAHGTIGWISKLFVIWGNIILGLVATYAFLLCTGKVPFVAVGTLNNCFMDPFQLKPGCDVVEG